MCGILGVAGSFASKTSDADFLDALDLIRHRGPDSGSIWRDSMVCLGHRRLSIIDLSNSADQPMRLDDLTIIFNGEIYNYRELKYELRALGHSFYTNSDTEVLLKAWQYWGAECLSRLEGMFSIAIWNATKAKLYLARDRFGEKPLYVKEDIDGIGFASEMPPLIRLAGKSIVENRAAIGLFFQYSYIPAPYGAFEGFSQLEPGCWMEWSPFTGIQRHKYYSLKESIAQSTIKPQLSYTDACISLKSILHDAIRIRIETADVPVATLLSGGIDSSIVTILAARIQNSDKPMSVYSLGFPEDAEFDETDFAKAVTANLPNVDHRIIEATEDNVLDFASNVINRLGEPFADASILPTSLLCSSIEEKVALGGDAADEIFAGYGVYPAILAGASLPSPIRKLISLIPKHQNPTAIRNETLRSAALFHLNLHSTTIKSYLSWRSYAEPKILKDLNIDVSESFSFAKAMEFSTINSLQDLQIIDLEFNLPNDMLKKVDYAGMFQSIEMRLPFLDSKLVHWILGLPDDYRLAGTKRKRILRDAFSDILPERILNRRKMGFLLPIRRWFRSGKLREELEAMLGLQTTLDTKTINILLREHSLGIKDHSVLLWSIYVYLKWQQMVNIWTGYRA